MNTTDPPTFTAHELRIVLDTAGDTTGDRTYRGYAGSFMRALCDAVFKADRINRAKLREVFPAIVDAVDYYETRPIERTRMFADMIDPGDPT